MQMTNGIQHTLTHTVSFQADGSRIKHTDVQSVLHTEPRAALQGPRCRGRAAGALSSYTSVMSLVGACLSAGFDAMTSGKRWKTILLDLAFSISSFDDL